jgi:hypothetical protein
MGGVLSLSSLAVCLTGTCISTTCALCPSSCGHAGFNLIYSLLLKNVFFKFLSLSFALLLLFFLFFLFLFLFLLRTHKSKYCTYCNLRRISPSRTARYYKFCFVVVVVVVVLVADTLIKILHIL